MGSTLHPKPGDRNAILRGVYEDNVRTTREKHTPPKSPLKVDPPAPPRRRRSVRATTSMAAGLVFVLVVALTVKHLDTSATPGVAAGDTLRSIPPVNLTASERLATATLPQAASPSLTDGQPLANGQAITNGQPLASTIPGSSTNPRSSIMVEPSSNAASGPPSVADLYGLHLETIVIDAGHGGSDPGAIGVQGLQEKDVTLDIARRLKKRLERYPGYRILLTRDGEQAMELRERIEYANENEADLFISIHVNWLPVDSIAPIETYYYGPNSDARALRLAQRENRNSGYSLAEFNDLTQSLGLDLKIQESREAAHSIQEGLVDGLRSMGRDVSDWGAKSGDFMVLLGVEAPSILAEIGSLSNPEEESKLLTVSYREKLAYILDEGIANYLRLHHHDNAHLENGSQEDKEGV